LLSAQNSPATAATPFRIFYRVLSEAPASGLALLLILMLLVSLLESVGLVLLVPMLESLGNGADSSRLLESVRAGFTLFHVPFGLATLLALFCVLVILRSVLSVIRARQNTRLQTELVDRVRRRCYSALLHADWRWLVTGRRSDHANTLMNEVSQLSNGLYFGIQLIGTVITMAAYLLAAMTLSWQACLISMATGALIFFMLKGLRRQAQQLGQSMSHAERDLMGNVQESLGGIKLAKILGAENAYLQRFDSSTRAMREENIDFQINHTRAGAVYQTVGALLLAAFLYAGIAVMQIPMATVLTLAFIFSRLLPMFASTQQQYQYWLHALPSVARCYELIAKAEAAAEPAYSHSAGVERVESDITLEALSLHYQGRQKPALDSISVHFKARTTTAIVGESGAGKSTLADVLMGLIAPDSGTLHVDGIDIIGPARMRWRASVAYVPQDAFLFHDSIRRNLLWAKPDARDDELHQALTRAAADFVLQLPKGLDTVVGDGGVLLSGGERQRIALARALLKRPALLILDEATSALDRGNEARIRQAIENLHGDLTVVIIGHRLATLEHADQVIVMAHGAVKAQGQWQDIAAHL
jgi:ATP-binding cassette, subfamily C, bacterial